MNLPDKPEVVLAKLEQCICPFCDKHSLRHIGGHLFMAHGIRFYEVKDLLGINRSRGFLPPDLKAASSERAKAQGLGVTPETRTKPGHTKGKKMISSSMSKLKNYQSKPEVKAKFKEVMSRPEVRSKANVTKRNMSDEDRAILTARVLGARDKFIERNGKEAYLEIRRKSSKKATVTIHGTEEGKPDLFYANIALKFVQAVRISRKRGIYNRVAQSINQKSANTQRMIKVAVERGLLSWTGEVNYPNGELTEKAIKILESEATK